MAIAARKRLLTNEEYHQMAAAGILLEDERVEIEGEIFEMMPIGNRHAACLRRLLHWLAPRLGTEVMHDVHDPLPLPDRRSEPQPDLVLLRAREDGYGAAPPTAADVLLVVEIDSSRLFDRNVKLPLYAAAGLPEAWLVDRTGEQLLVCREPSPDG